MPTRIISNPARVYAYVAALTPMQMSAGMKGIGLEKDGELIAGVLYEGFNAHNVWMHVASHRPGRWLQREYLRTCFEYPFLQVGVKRAYMVSEESIRLRPVTGFWMLDRKPPRVYDRYTHYFGRTASYRLTTDRRNGSAVLSIT